HDGYARRGRDCIHGRTVWARDGYVVVADRLAGSASTSFALTWQCAPSVIATCRTAGLVELSGGHVGGIEWVASVDMRARVSTGGDDAHDGWVSPSLNVRVPAPRVLVTGALPPSGTAAVLSVVSDGSRVAVERCRWPEAIAAMGIAPEGLVVRS